ncbi:PqqD family protein [Plantactinospora sp. S1510]|uniref:PqqD family protein n=1 Tax=Plantactinospora alkalitolerans TaxID=2789879 RepID=A0ABS0GWR1_9ACTN|nr:PqqD family protein [Plantactinospora alkalitolerans]MBF9130418.1 PqqD family protein [Plantactinospora alkalitolerans]
MTGRAAVVYRVGRTGTAWRQAGDEIVVLDTESSVYFGLDRFGALLWTRLVDGATTADLVAALVAATPVEPERAGADVQSFLDTLLRYGLIQVS